MKIYAARRRAALLGFSIIILVSFAIREMPALAADSGPAPTGDAATALQVAPHPRPPNLITMPFLSSEVGASFFANRKVPKSDAPPLPASVSQPLSPPSLTRAPLLGHKLPETATSKSGRKRADFAIARKQTDGPPPGAPPQMQGKSGLQPSAPKAPPQ